MKIHSSDKAIAYITLLSGLTISAVAIYYSVAGLTAIFAAAVIPIIVMGVALEISKLAATVWLKQNWSRAPNFIRGYLLAAILILMLITSMGIFGFLSKAHSDQSLVSGDVQSKIALYDEKIKIERENIANAQQVIKQMDAAVNGIISTGDQEVKLRDGSTRVNSAAERSLQIRRSQAKDRATLTKQIEQSQAKIISLQEESAPIRAEVRKVEAEVGPIKYIANFIYGDNPDANVLEKAVTWVIIIIVVVFDPLAVILLLASQYSFMWFRQQRDEEELKVDDDILNIESKDNLVESTVLVEPEVDLDEVNAMLAQLPKEEPTLESVGVEEADNNEPQFDEKKPLEEWNEMIAEAERAVEQENEEEEQVILDTAHHSEKAAMAAWKHDNPNNSLKHQRMLLEKGIIKELPWTKYIDNQAAQEAEKWAKENPETEESKQAQEWAQEQAESVTWMEHDENGNQIKKTKEGYQQNAEQGEGTLWQRIQDAKK